MNKIEYMQRVFESQIKSIKDRLSYTAAEIESLEMELREKTLDLQGDQVLLTYAEEEMRKLK